MTNKIDFQHRKNVIEIIINTDKPSENLDVLLISDVHLDNSKTRRDILKKHIQEIESKNGIVISGGDLMDLMQGKSDRRSSKSSLMDIHKIAYIDDVIDETADFLSQFSVPYILLDGNHETAVLNKLETDPTRRLSKALENKNIKCTYGRYQNFLKFIFREKGKRSRNFVLAFHHGAWGGKITKGVLSVIRYASIYPDANAIWSGHTHDGWYVAHPQYKLDQSGSVKQRLQHHIKTGTYKDEFTKGQGWATEKLVMPSTCGGFIMNLNYKRTSKTPTVKASFESRLMAFN